ncbi:class I tRNA ligase family protein [Streptomyces sp. RB6PN25]|uniref:Class I tRNA ligase family protein n=1 Tax=Streptomyces humicola TaxID=2953240 RepID=A0ABT1Q2U1_9ACTN|nr:class I tRNA ligase family protein [Streptomyces humicola]MCQ4084252.1 class I tRNA ligase family protein [Streptomyces humicola]
MTDRSELTTVVLSPPPTPNGPLHVGHLAGPYVAADIAVREARRGGRRIFALCGLDDHQNYVLAKARQERADVLDVRNRYARLIRDAFARAGVVHDGFTQPLTEPGYRSAVTGFLGELVGSGALPVQEWSTPACPSCRGVAHHAYVSGRCPHCGAECGGGTCEGCGGYTPAARLVDPRCTRCGSAATGEKTVRGPVLPLEEHRAALEAAWCTAILPARARELAARLLAEDPMPVVPLSYPTDWGIELGAGTPGHRLDVWAEMGLGYLYTIGRHLQPAATGLREHVAAWQGLDSLWAFLGLDNAFYYLAMFPALFAAAGVPAQKLLGGLVVNEFYRLEGQKFSTSRNHAVWANELLEKEDPRAVRAFIAWDRPAPHPTNFTLDRFRTTTDAWDLDGGQAPVDPNELARAESALTLEHFDAALAARCLLGTNGAAPCGPLDAIIGSGKAADR